MTRNELEQKYKTAYRIAEKERRWRDHVFPEGHPRREEKLREMDRLKEILTEFKDFIKERVDVEHEQLFLINLPTRYE